MRYFLAVICPPAAVLLCGHRGAAALNLLLTLCFWLPGVIHALAIVSQYEADARKNAVGAEMRLHRMNSVIRKA